MSCDKIDLKAYHLGEATAAERIAVEGHLRDCAACAEEVERLELTRTMLAALPEEPMPQRIAFVSDKIFEPRWWQRLFSPHPLWGLASAAMVAAAFTVNLAYRPEPLVVAKNSRVTQQEINARIEHEVSRRMETAVAAAVKQAVAESEARQTKVLKAAVDKLDVDHKAELLAVEENFNVLRKKTNLLLMQTARAEEVR